MTTTPEAPAPGWYPDPQGGPFARWWDGTQWTAATQQPAGPPWRPLRALARAVAALLVVATFAHGALAVGMASRRNVIHDFLYEDATLDDVNDNDALIVVLGILLFTISLATGIVWLVWFHAVYRNAATFRRVRHPRWAVWGWIVPLVNLFRPKQMVNDAWLAGDEQLDVYTTPSRVSPVVQLWWLAFLAGTLLASGGRAITRGADDKVDPGLGLDALAEGAGWLMSASIAFVVCGVLAIVMVLQMTDRLERRNAARYTMNL